LAFIEVFAPTLHSFYTILSRTCSRTPRCSVVRLEEQVVR